MGRIVLISDAETPLGVELADAYLQAGDTVVAAVPPQAPKPERAGGAFLAVEWNRRSSLSARNLLLTAVNRFGGIDEAVVLDVPGFPEKLAQELSSAEIEAAFDSRAKGTLFLAREISAHFAARGRGVLCLAAFSAQAADSPLPPLEAACRGAFHGLARSLIATGGPVTANLFLSFTFPARDFAQFLLKTLEEKGRKISGRAFTLEPKQGFLQGLVPASRKP